MLMNDPLSIVHLLIPMKITHLITIFFVVLGLTSCEDVIDVKLEEGETQLAVDGWITDQPGPYTIRLTTTAPYFNNTTTPRVKGATVTLTDSEGNSEILKESEPGMYVTSQLQGKIGNSYTLSIRYEGEEYTAQTQIKRVPPIDSLGVKYRKGGGFTEEGYYVTYNGPELPGTGDYYRFKVFRNDTLLNKPENLSFTDDRFVDGNYIEDIQRNFDPFKSGDEIRVETWSITEDAYLFYNELRQQIQNGGLFANPPANVRTNIINKNSNERKAVGWFGGAAISSKEVAIP